MERWLWPIAMGVALGGSGCLGHTSKRGVARPDEYFQEPLAHFPPPSFTGTSATSYSSRFASSLRDSHVSVARPQYGELERIPITYDERVARVASEQPVALIVSPDGRHAVLQRGSWQLLLDERGHARQSFAGEVMAWDSGVYVEGQGYDWEGKPGALLFHGSRQISLVSRIEGGRYAVIERADKGPWCGYSRRPPPMDVVLFEGGLDGRSAWWGGVTGFGVAAVIAADYTTIIATADELLVYPPGAQQQRAPLGARRRLSEWPRWLSIVGTRIALIDKGAVGWSLHVFEGNLTPAFELPIPFDVEQPAIAGSGGRIYLAGHGLAALDDGKVTWSRASDSPLRVSSFEDGSLAVVAGKKLELLSTEGEVVQSFEAAEPLLTPPAIAADGSLWIASADALYVARARRDSAGGTDASAATAAGDP